MGIISLESVLRTESNLENDIIIEPPQALTYTQKS